MFNPKGQETLIKHHQTNKEIEHPTVKKNDENEHVQDHQTEFKHISTI